MAINMITIDGKGILDVILFMLVTSIFTFSRYSKSKK